MAAEEDPQGKAVIQEHDIDEATGQIMYDVCEHCNFDSHICHGCGTPLTHSGHEKVNDVWRLHGTRCVD